MSHSTCIENTCSHDNSSKNTKSSIFEAVKAGLVYLLYFKFQ